MVLVSASALRRDGARYFGDGRAIGMKLLDLLAAENRICWLQC